MPAKFTLIPYKGKEKRKNRNHKSNELTEAIRHYVNVRGEGFLFRVQKGLVMVERFAAYKGQPTIDLLRPVAMIDGLFDLQGIAPDGKIVIIEVKIGRDTLRQKQREFGCRIGRFGGYVMTVGSKPEFLCKWKKVLEGKNKELFDIFNLNN